MKEAKQWVFITHLPAAVTIAPHRQHPQPAQRDSLPDAQDQSHRAQQSGPDPARLGAVPCSHGCWAGSCPRAAEPAGRGRDEAAVAAELAAAGGLILPAGKAQALATSDSRAPHDQCVPLPELPCLASTK